MTARSAGREQFAAPAGVAARIRRHADALAQAGRSPLDVALMRGAAADLEADGVVASVFAGVELTPGSVPALRLMAALHRLVLRGQAAELARFFPSAGGSDAAAGSWPAAARAIAAHEGEIAAAVRRGVQTNEPGRAVALFGGLLWVSERERLPARLAWRWAARARPLRQPRTAGAVARRRGSLSPVPAAAAHDRLHCPADGQGMSQLRQGARFRA